MEGSEIKEAEIQGRRDGKKKSETGSACAGFHRSEKGGPRFINNRWHKELTALRCTALSERNFRPSGEIGLTSFNNGVSVGLEEEFSV